ncbi:secretin [Bacterioplanes sanyensis]|uniref:Secretin n=1 Tax=Bacterioplanes sanyensis TaxID=1249553 RepID=A0A222FK18_9GAMM|nr:type II and III secretion system protein family protein [Bacterioplanes sanyensis]ASP38834.1 secretin [Bacterioplanes sanyensis]
MLVCSTVANAADLQLKVGKGQLVHLPSDAKTVFVADPAVANYQLPASRSLFVYGKAHGDTDVYVLDSQQRTIYRAAIEVRNNLARLQSALDEQFSDAKVTVVEQGRKLVLRGSSPSALDIESMLAMAQSYVEEDSDVVNDMHLDIPKQVNIRLRIAEVKREVSNQLGIKWGTLANGQINFYKRPVEMDLFGFTAFDNPLTGVLDALAEEGLAKVLAEPNLTALSGEEATFHAGGSFPYTIPDPDLNTYTVDFRDYGVRLDMRPTVMEGQRIRLKVRPEVSNLSTEVNLGSTGLLAPSLQVRSAETTVELASGESFALAGLIQANDVSSVSKLPFLGDIPVLGALFRSEDFRREETELVIIVTAYAVEPTAQDNYQFPGQQLQLNSQFERLLWGETYHHRQQPLPASISGRPDFIY